MTITTSSGKIPATLEGLDPESWLGDAQAWVAARLVDAGIRQLGPLQEVRTRPWSAVYRAGTVDGPVYFKACSWFQRHEPALTAYLHHRYPQYGPPVVASDARRAWLLMTHAGDSLHDLQESRMAPVIAHWRAALATHSRLQIAAAAAVDDLLALGVPDRRLAHLPELFDAMLADPVGLAVGKPGALDHDEYKRLLLVQGHVERLCYRLASDGLPETLQHDDLYDKHVFLTAGRYLALDWGDARIAHPFCLLAVPLQRLQAQYRLEPGDTRLLGLRDDYLKAWTGYGRLEDLRQALQTALVLAAIGRAQTWVDVLTGNLTGADGRYVGMFQRGLAEWLRMVLRSAEDDR